MNVGAIGGYRPISYINPYATNMTGAAAAGSEKVSPTDKTQATNKSTQAKRKTPPKRAQSVPKTDETEQTRQNGRKP